MRDSVREGVDALYAIAGLDPRQYKVFSAHSDAKQSRLAPPMVPAAVEAGVRPSAEAAATRPDPVRLNTPPKPLIPTGPANGTWDVLESALPSAAADPAGHRALEALQRRTVCVLPLAGGVGVTSIIGALSRMLALSGERVGVLDGGGDAVLRYHFGGEDAASGGLLPINGHPAAPPVRLLSGSDDRFGSRPNAEAERADACWPRLPELPGAVDRVLVDGGPGLGAASRHWALGATHWLAVLMPDLRCVLRIPQLLDLAAAQGESGGRQVSVHLLVNGFDPAIPIHSEIMSRLEHRYGDLLLPVTIQRSDLIDDALARGESLESRNPEAEVVRNLRELTQWLRSAQAVGAGEGI